MGVTIDAIVRLGDVLRTTRRAHATHHVMHTHPVRVIKCVMDMRHPAHTRARDKGYL